MSRPIYHRRVHRVPACPVTRTTATPTTYVIPSETTSPKFGAAFAKGCGGPMATIQSGLQPGHFASFCTPATWPMLRQVQQDHARDWYYGDHAFYRRGRYYRVTKNAYQYQPSAAELASATPDRFKATGLQAVPDWTRHGSSVVICPNSALYMAQHGVNAHDWVMECVRVIARHSPRNIVVRWKAQSARRPLHLDLHDAWAVVVYNSNAAVEALQAGIPIFVTCPWASTTQMGLSDLTRIESPIYPDNRLAFLWALADHQWSLPEIASGLAWRTLQDPR